MNAARLDIDHVFLFIAPDGPEIDAFKRLGLTETYRRAHPGQGTANVCFASDNLFLELLWLTSEAEARSPAVARTRLWERSQWRTRGSCPLGMAFRGSLAGVGLPTWDYQPPYLQHLQPAGAGIPVATLSDDAVQPMVFVSPGRDAPMDWPDARRGALQHAAGFGAVRRVDLLLPGPAASAPHWPVLTAASPGLGVTAAIDGHWGLRLTLGARSGPATQVLEMVSSQDQDGTASNTGAWRVTLADQTL